MLEAKADKAKPMDQVELKRKAVARSQVIGTTGRIQSTSPSKERLCKSLPRSKRDQDQHAGQEEEKEEA